MWYSAIGLVATLLIGIAVSWITGFNNVDSVHSDLITPPMRRLYSKHFQNFDGKIHNISSEVSFLQVLEVNILFFCSYLGPKPDLEN